MSLLARLVVAGDEEPDPEDILSAALGIIFPDDVANQHGDHSQSLVYTSPHLPKPLPLSLADPKGDEDRKLFSHYLWNSSLQLAEFVEAGTLGLAQSGSVSEAGDGQSQSFKLEKEVERIAPSLSEFDVTGLSTIELGAGTALPSLMSALLGARRVVVTDYPAPEVLTTLRHNVTTIAQPSFSPLGRIVASESEGTESGVEVHGHGWGELSDTWEQQNRHAFDRVYAADCLWMPWQHENLRTSIDWFLGEGPDARAWVVAGFHTGRENMRGFFDEDGLKSHGLVVDRIWERDCNGVDREWAWDRPKEEISERKRWLVIAMLKRRAESS